MIRFAPLKVAAFLAAVAAAPMAMASPVCTKAPQAKWMTPAQMKGRVAKMGYRDVKVFQVSGSCYEIYAHTKDGKRAEVYFNPTYSWQSRFFFDDDNDRSDLQPADFAVDEVQKAYGLLNLRAGIRTPDQKWRLEVALKNALDAKYVIDAGNTGDNFGIPSFIAGQPRMFTAEIGFQF